MTVFTKQVIEEKFLELLEKEQLGHISVKDIADACKINRNTFYYHFASISDLVNSLIKKSVDELIEKYPTIDSLEEGLTVAASFASTYQTSIRHIYDSTSRSIFERHLWKICEYVISKYVHSSPKAKDLSNTDLELIIDFYKCECFGFVINWINDGMPANVAEKIQRLCELNHEKRLFPY